MAVFRIERTRDYTVMSNHHLRDKALSLKSKGLLSMMLSLPEDWNYTTPRPRQNLQGGRGRHRRGAAGAGERRVHRPQPDAGPAGPHQRQPSMSSMSSPSPKRRIRPSRIRLHQIRKTRIWLTRIRKSPQN